MILEISYHAKDTQIHRQLAKNRKHLRLGNGPESDFRISQNTIAAVKATKKKLCTTHQNNCAKENQASVVGPVFSAS